MSTAPVSPEPVQPAGRCNPKRAVAVFDQVVHEALLRVFVRHLEVNSLETQMAVAGAQSIELLQSSAPDCSVVTFEQRGDCAGVPVSIFGHDAGKHRLRPGVRFVLVYDAVCGLASRVEAYESGACRDPIIALARL